MSQTIQTPEENTQGQGDQVEEAQEKETWFTRNQTLWEFIKFQILSNISTATRILLSIAGTWFFITNLSLTQPSRSLFLTIQLLDLEDLEDS